MDEFVFIGNTVGKISKISNMENVNFVYQPIFDVKAHKPFAYEALMRHKFHNTGDFLANLISSLDRALFWNHLLNTTFLHFKASKSKQKISLNCNQDDVVEPWFLSSIMDAFERTNINPNQVIFELTEHNGVLEHSKTVQILEALVSTGASLALDDFGIKHCNLDALCFLPIKEIKIDGKFIRNLENKRCSNAIDYLVRFAKSIDVDVIVEHVESRQQVRQLSALGVRYMQGFYFSEGDDAILGQELITKIYGEKISDSRANEKSITQAASLKREVQ